MQRSLFTPVKTQLSPKITLISGPRQVGKTTLAQSLVKSFSYYNYDQHKDAKVFLKQQWDASTNLVIFDEIHKMKKWKLWLKGLFDEGRFKNQYAVVTGSARLSHLKKVGDSLAGRYYEYRLHPFDLKELKNSKTTAEQNYKKLVERGGFPEPLLHLSLDDSRKWRRTHTDVILRQDLLSLEVIRDLGKIELLLELLSTRVGSTVSFNSLAEDLSVSDLTIKKWVGLLEDLYVIFRVSSSTKNIARGLKKSGKYYFYDLARVQGDVGAIFENLVALSIRKALDMIEDTKGLKTTLSFLRNKEKQEVDFLIEIAGYRPLMIECKTNDDQISKNFHIFRSYFKSAEQIQLVAHLDRRFDDTKSGIRVENGLTFLENLDLCDLLT